MLIAARLPERTEPAALTDIAPLVGIQPRSLARHAHDLWPHWEGHYRLTKEQAVTLIRRACYAWRKLPPRSDYE